MTFHADVDKDGKLHLFDRSAYDRYVRRLKGKRVRVTVVEHDGASISTEQRGYFHAVVCGQIGRRTGHTILEVKDRLKGMFLADGMGGVRSTESLDEEEMGDLIEQSCAWAAEFLDLVIDEPRPAARKQTA